MNQCSRSIVVISTSLLLVVTLQIWMTNLPNEDMQGLGVPGIRSGKNFNRSILTHKEARKHPHLLDAGVCLVNAKTSRTASCFPSAICIGAMKAGTFELKQWLSEHPLVHPASSEQHFFGRGTALMPNEWEKYVTSPNEWALSLRDIEKGAVTFEKTPYYMASPVAAAELSALLPSVRLIVMLRDPVARAYSAFNHHCDRNSRILDVGGTVVFNADCHRVEHCCCGPLDDPHSLTGRGLGGTKKKKIRRTVCSPESFQKYLSTAVNDTASPLLGTILRKGLYADQIQTYLAHFRATQILILDGQTFARDPSTTMQQVFTFLGLGGHAYHNAVKNERGFWYLKGMDSKSNKQTPYAPMLQESRTWLEIFYRTPDARLRSLVPDTIFSWMP